MLTKQLFKNEKKFLATMDKLVAALDSFQKNAKQVKVHHSRYWFRTYFDIDIIMKGDKE